MKPVLIGGAVLALVVGILLWKHEGDARRDGQIALLDSIRVVQAREIDSLTKHTDSVAGHTVAAADTFTKHDTAWRRHADTVTATVDRIVHDTVTDSTKIRELVVLVTETKDTADAAIRAAERLRDSIPVLLTAFTNERAAWVREKGTLTTEIDLLKRQSRHWGLCAMPIGIGVTRLPDHTIRGGLQAGVGICYRY